MIGQLLFKSGVCGSIKVKLAAETNNDLESPSLNSQEKRSYYIFASKLLTFWVFLLSKYRVFFPPFFLNGLVAVTGTAAKHKGHQKT